MNRVVKELEAIIKERGESYGSPVESFTRIAEIWTAITKHKLKDGERIEPHDVALCMSGLKLYRAAVEPEEFDHYLDGASYFSLGEEVSIEELKDMPGENRTITHITMSKEDLQEFCGWALSEEDEGDGLDEYYTN